MLRPAVYSSHQEGNEDAPKLTLGDNPTRARQCLNGWISENKTTGLVREGGLGKGEAKAYKTQKTNFRGLFRRSLKANWKVG